MFKPFFIHNLIQWAFETQQFLLIIKKYLSYLSSNMIQKKSACEFIHDFFNLYKVFAKYVKVIMHMHIYQFLEYILKFYACTNASLVFMLILTIKKKNNFNIKPITVLPFQVLLGVAVGPGTPQACLRRSVTAKQTTVTEHPVSRCRSPLLPQCSRDSFCADFYNHGP